MVNVDKFLGIANKEKRKYGLNDDYCAMVSMLRIIDDKLYVVVPFVRSDDKVWKKDSGIVPEYYSVIDPKEMKLLEFNKTTEKNFVIKDIKKNNSDGSFDKEISRYIVDTKLKYKNYIKDDIKNNMASEYPSFSKMMESWTDVNNPFQDSYIVSVKDVRDINETVTTIKNLDNVDIVKYSESMVGELINIFDAVKTGTICLVVGLVLVTAFLINNTIKITIFSRRNEIDIMRLVGTSNTVIKLPFLFEGLFIGVLGAIIPILVTIFGYTYIYNAVSSLGTSNILSIIKLTSPELIVYKTSLFILIIGAVVGMFGSVKAVRKYLTV